MVPAPDRTPLRGVAIRLATKALLAALRFTRHQQVVDVYHDDDDDFLAQYAPEHAWVGLTLLKPLCGEFGAGRFRSYHFGSDRNDFSGFSFSEVAPSGPKTPPVSCSILSSFNAPSDPPAPSGSCGSDSSSFETASRLSSEDV